MLKVGWPKLEQLDCSHNNIPAIDCSVKCCFIKAPRVYIVQEELKKLKMAIKQVRLAKSLTSLTLSHNALTQVASKPKPNLTSLKNLKMLKSFEKL